MRLHRLAVTLALAALTAAACTSAKAPGWTFPAATAPAASRRLGSRPPASTSRPAARAPPRPPPRAPWRSSSFDLGFQPKALTVDSPGRVRGQAPQRRRGPHDVTFADGTKIAANAGETTTGTVTIPAERDRLHLLDPGPRGRRDEGHGHGRGRQAGAAAGGDTRRPRPGADVAADPNAPAYTLYDATAPPVARGHVHDIDLVVEETTMTVAPASSRVWTFNGTVPGPVIRVTVGDTIRIHLKNPATNQLPHSVDFHASQVAWNDEMTSIKPGEEKLYEWTADYAGVWMYHCGTAPALHHIANGMYGMVIVEPKGGLPGRQGVRPRPERVVPRPQGDTTSLTRHQPAPRPRTSWSSTASPTSTRTTRSRSGPARRVRVFVLDAGPNIDSSFHIVGRSSTR